MAKAVKGGKKRERNDKGQYVPDVAAVEVPTDEETVVAKIKKFFTAEVDMDHGMFGDFVSDDDSFVHEATFVRSKANEKHIGVFVGDGQEVIVGIPLFEGKSITLTFTPKEAKLVAETILAASINAKKHKKLQKEHRASLPMKKSKSKK